MIQKESRLDVADNSGAKVAMVIGTKGKSTARGRFTRIAVGIGDRVTCTYCDSTLSLWEAGDDPVLDHQRWYPHCHLNKALLGGDSDSDYE